MEPQHVNQKAVGARDTCSKTNFSVRSRALKEHSWGPCLTTTVISHANPTRFPPTNHRPLRQSYRPAIGSFPTWPPDGRRRRRRRRRAPCSCLPSSATHRRLCLDRILTIAAALSYKSPFASSRVTTRGVRAKVRQQPGDGLRGRVSYRRRRRRACLLWWWWRLPPARCLCLPTTNDTSAVCAVDPPAYPPYRR